jgi:cell division protein FtsI/penicillin-binding protein 2
VAWTPLHAADAYATLARGGLRMKPRIDADLPVDARDLRLDPSAVQEAMRGLERSTNDMTSGTGARLTFDGQKDPIFNAPGVDVWGKTGTADAPALLVDLDGDGPGDPVIVRDGDHSWFVVLAGPKGGRPKYAIAVMMEYGGSGGRVSGPITNQIVHALVAEGYLPSGDAQRGGQ